MCKCSNALSLPVLTANRLTALINSLTVKPAREVIRTCGVKQGVDQCGQATKGVWGMPWRQEAMKGVEDCDKLGGLVKRELIPRSLNYPRLNP